jgi:hypothetical protein
VKVAQKEPEIQKKAAELESQTPGKNDEEAPVAIKPLKEEVGFETISGPPAKNADVKSESATAPVSPDDLKRGLVFHLNFDSEPVAGIIPDLSGQGNNGKAVNVQWITDGHRGGSVQFGLTKSYITVSNNASLNPPQLTLSAWIKTSYQDWVWRRIFDKGTGQGYVLSMCGDDKDESFQGEVDIEPGKTWAHSGIKVTDGRWHHVLGTFDGTDAKIYVDGRPAGKPARWEGKIPYTAYDLTIGANRSNPNPALGEVDASFNGMMDDVMMFNRALSAEEVRTLFDLQQRAENSVSPADGSVVNANRADLESVAPDNIYVSCFPSGTIEKFDSNGNRSTFASGLNGPSGLAFDSSGNLYAANYWNGIIEKFDSSGKRSTFVSGLNTPQALAFDRNGNLYVSMYSSGTIEKFDSSGKGSIWASGLFQPVGLAFNNSDNLYAPTRSSGPDKIILKFDSRGNASVFASAPNGPTSIGFDSSGNLYVATYYGGTIEKFDSSGNRSTFAQGLNKPVGLAFDSKGYLYATESGTGTIKKFDASGNGTLFASGLSGPTFIATRVP